MAIYLRFRIGPYRLLMDAERVVEVCDRSSTGQEGMAAGHRSWRGQALRAFDGAALLGLAQGEHGATIVCRPAPGARPMLVDVDEISGTAELDEHGFRALPPLPESLARLAGAAYVDPGGERIWLRCRGALGLEAGSQQRGGGRGAV